MGLGYVVQHFSSIRRGPNLQRPYLALAVHQSMRLCLQGRAQYRFSRLWSVGHAISPSL